MSGTKIKILKVQQESNQGGSTVESKVASEDNPSTGNLVIDIQQELNQWHEETELQRHGRCVSFPPPSPKSGNGKGFEVPGGDLGEKGRSSVPALGGDRGGRPGCKSAFDGFLMDVNVKE